MDEDFVYVRCPLGVLKIRSTEHGVSEVSFSEEDKDTSAGISGWNAECKKQLEQYFLGTRKDFDLKYNLHGTDFQTSVWNALIKIPYSKTRSYKQLSEDVGDVKAVRAVARANAVNPIAIIIPCHRVVGSNNKLTGYAGGLWRKKWLLDKEQGATQMTLF